jgi:hypothetical protein
MLERAGLRLLRAWGGFDGSALTMESPRLVLLTQKGEPGGARLQIPGDRT